MIQITEGCRMPVQMKNTDQWRKLPQFISLFFEFLKIIL